MLEQQISFLLAQPPISCVRLRRHFDAGQIGNPMLPLSPFQSGPQCHQLTDDRAVADWFLAALEIEPDQISLRAPTRRVEAAALPCQVLRLEFTEVAAQCLCADLEGSKGGYAALSVRKIPVQNLTDCGLCRRLWRAAAGCELG